MSTPGVFMELTPTWSKNGVNLEFAHFKNKNQVKQKLTRSKPGVFLVPTQDKVQLHALFCTTALKNFIIRQNGG